MIKKILFFVESPFNQRDFERFGIELLMKNNFEVEVWDLTNILHPNVIRNYTPPDPIDKSYYRVFNNKSEAINEIKKLSSDSFIIPFFYYLSETYYFWKAISLSKANYAAHVANSVISEEESGKKDFSHYCGKLKRFTIRKLINQIFIRIPFTWLGIKPPTFILAGGDWPLKKSYRIPYPFNKTTEVLWAHALDYDLYLKEKNDLSESEPNTAVFLDEYIPFHPDYLYMKIKPYSYPQDYYPLLCRFFDFLEEKYNLKIIIAAHPRSCYESYPDYFNGRPVIRGKTAELVKKSGLVIIHSSTSINFAVLFRKPIIFITTDSLKRSIEGPWIETMAGLFNKKPLNISNSFEIDLRKEMIVDEVIYNNYRNAYIKRNGTEDMPFWEIVADRVKPLS